LCRKGHTFEVELRTGGVGKDEDIEIVVEFAKRNLIGELGCPICHYKRYKSTYSESAKEENVLSWETEV
jgi:hypothetical protein